MKKILFPLLILLLRFHSVHAQGISPDSSFALAQQKQEQVLLVFSGSDWCAPCMRFEKKVLNDPSFLQFTEGHLIVVKADFPQSKKLSPQTVKENEELARKFNPSGSFPLIVLLDPDQKVQTYLEYHNEGPGDFIELLNHYLQ